MAGEAQQIMEAYLGQVRRRLRGMNESDIRDIVQELRSHITDRAGGNGQMTAAGVGDALARLGSPEELASQYLTEDLLSRAEVSRSPIEVLRSLFRWAAFSAAGFIILLGSLLTYFLAAVFIITALVKPFHPQTAGLWIFPDNADGVQISLRLGFGTPPANGRELLGWWMVPVGLAVGCGLVMLTTRFALWCARRFRKSSALPGG
jgi:hypothetical protein